MSRLARTLALHPGELPESYAGRLALTNGVSATEFANDMKIIIRDLEIGEPIALVRLADVSGTTLDQIRHGAVVKKDGLWIRSEKIARRKIDRLHPRYCPACLLDDFKHGTALRPAARPWARSVWAMPSVLTCPVHRILLQQDRDALPSFSSLPLAFQHRRRWVEDALEKVVEVGLSPLENFLHDRLSDRPTEPGILDRFPLYISARLAELVGSNLLFGKERAFKTLTPTERVDAGSAGFPIAHHGLETFLAGLYSDLSDRAFVGARGLGGALFSWLQDSYSNEDAAGLRDFVREHAVHHLPLGPGDQFFGSVEERVWHSLWSASKEYHVHVKRLRKVLMQAGKIAPETISFHDSRVLFNAADAHDLITNLEKEISGQRARQYLGLNIPQWAAIRKAGLLRPIIVGNHDTRSSYSQEGLDEFMNSILYERGEPGPDLVSLSQAVKFCVCGHADIIRLLQSGSLDRVAIDPSPRGILSVRVDPAEIKSKLPRSPLPGFTAREAASRIGVSIDSAHYLIAQGHIPSMPFREYAGSREARLISEADLKDFTKNFMGLKELVGRLEIGSARCAMSKMRERGVEPAVKIDVRRGVMYRRQEVEPFLPCREIATCDPTGS